MLDGTIAFLGLSDTFLSSSGSSLKFALYIRLFILARSCVIALLTKYSTK